MHLCLCEWNINHDIAFLVQKASGMMLQSMFLPVWKRCCSAEAEDLVITSDYVLPETNAITALFQEWEAKYEV